MRKSKEAALTYTRASLSETLAQVEEFARMYGSLQTVADRIVELEAELQERDEQLAAATRERDALRAALVAERGKGLSPEAIVQILRRRVYCVGDFGRLLPVLREGQRDQSGGVTVDTGEEGQQATPQATVLMMTVQELTPAAAPALAPLFAASSPPPSPTVAVATAPLPLPAPTSTSVVVGVTPAAPTKEKKSPGRKKRVTAQPQDEAKKLEVAKAEAGGDAKQQENTGEEARDDTKVKEKDDDEEEEEEEEEEDIQASDSEMASRTRSAGPTKRRRGVPLWTKRKRSASVTKQIPTPPLRRGPPARRGRPPRVKTDMKQDEPHPIKQLRETRDVTPRHILQWPQPPVDFDGQGDGPHSTGEGAPPAFQTLDFRVVASLEQSKPWDSMCSHRTRWLRIPDLASPAVLEWATRCLKAQYVRRQAYWERLHWLPDSCCKGVQWEKYKVARQERATLADREWKGIYADSVRLMAENLLAEDVWCDPGLWPLPEHPVLLLPKSVDLHAQIRLADSNEPVRLYFVNAPTQHPFFAEGLATTYPTKQLAPHVGGEDPDVEDSSEGEAEWNVATKRKRATPKRMSAKENGGLMQANGAQDEEDDPEAE